jgi:hypothetical protein
MALIGSIDGVPLFTTPQEAIAWAVANGTTGFHEHMFEGQVGYMGGQSHTYGKTPIQNRKIKKPTRSNVNINRTTGSSGGSGGGSGGGY